MRKVKFDKSIYMKAFLTASILLSLMLFTMACSKEDPGNNLAEQLTLEGILRKSDNITTFQYGHFFIDTYALRSESIDLEVYVDQQVRIIGSKIEGYPVEDGPEYLEVKQVDVLWK